MPPPGLAAAIEKLAEEATQSGELAVTHRLFRVPEVRRGPAEQPGWIREIAVFRHAEGEWRIVHEHRSIA